MGHYLRLGRWHAWGVIWMTFPWPFVPFPVISHRAENRARLCRPGGRGRDQSASLNERKTRRKRLEKLKSGDVSNVKWNFLIFTRLGIVKPKEDTWRDGTRSLDDARQTDGAARPHVKFRGAHDRRQSSYCETKKFNIYNCSISYDVKPKTITSSQPHKSTYRWTCHRFFPIENGQRLCTENCTMPKKKGTHSHTHS